MCFSGKINFLKLFPVFLCSFFSLKGQQVIKDDLTKGKWYVEGNLNDSLVKISRKRNNNNPFRQFVFAVGTVLHRCDSVYQSGFDANGNEVKMNKLDCNSPAIYGLKNQILMINNGNKSYYFYVEPKKGNGSYLLKRTKEEYYYQR